MSLRPFEHARAADARAAVVAGAAPGAAFIAGGVDLMQLWKAGAASPERVIDIGRLPLAGIEAGPAGVTIGALARMSDVAASEVVAQAHPLIAQAILAGACGQIRNMASVGGNLLQRTRCVYFRTPDLPCNKRAPGAGCGARGGHDRQAALFGASPACVAAHPSDLAVALAALDAEVETLGPSGARRLPVTALYRPPGEDPSADTVLAPGELITAVHVPAQPGLAARSTFLKVRDRASFEFAVVSVAAALDVEDGRIVAARLAAGAVAYRPWRFAEAEAALVGRAPGPEAFAEAAALAVERAEPLGANAFKVELLRRAVVRALETAGAAR